MQDSDDEDVHHDAPVKSRNRGGVESREAEDAVVRPTTPEHSKSSRNSASEDDARPGDETEAPDGAANFSPLFKKLVPLFKDLKPLVRPDLSLPPLAELKGRLKEVKVHRRWLRQEISQAYIKLGDVGKALRELGELEEADAEECECQQLEEASRLKQRVEKLQRECVENLEESKQLKENLLIAGRRQRLKLLTEGYSLF